MVKITSTVALAWPALGFTIPLGESTHERLTPEQEATIRNYAEGGVMKLEEFETPKSVEPPAEPPVDPKDGKPEATVAPDTKPKDAPAEAKGGKAKG